MNIYCDIQNQRLVSSLGAVGRVQPRVRDGAEVPVLYEQILVSQLEDMREVGHG
jgi:hypothetical protein